METYMQMLGRLAKNASRGAAKLGTKAKYGGFLRDIWMKNIIE